MLQIDHLAKIVNGDSSSNNFNSLIETGFYSANLNYSNSPENITALVNLLVINGNDIIHQIIFRSANNIYIRRYKKSSSSWDAWYNYVGTIVT